MAEQSSSSEKLPAADAKVDLAAGEKGPETGARALEQDIPDHLQPTYLTGWRLHTTTVGLCIGMFLVNLEISIVSTSLVSITNDLQHFGQAAWIVTAYLLTYTSFMIILAKVSDVLGRKTLMLFAVGVFTIFSGGCAASKTIFQLIVCRAFQGIGGCGVYSLTMIIIVEMVPPPKWPGYLVLITSLFACAMVLGPIFGGLINLHSSWIWVFLLNVPGGVLAFALLAISLPAYFPYHDRQRLPEPRSLSRIDFLGAFLLLAAMTLHIVGLQQAASLYGWTSADVLAPLLVSAFFWIAFFVSQWYVTKPQRRPDPVFPWRFCQNRVVMGIIVNSFLSGAISTTCIITLPLRYQAAAGSSPLDAGIRLIPLSLAIQIGAMLVAILTRKGRMAPIYLLLVGATLQLIGCVFLSRGFPNDPDWNGLYGIEAVTGLGVGLSIGVVTLMIPYAAENQDRATATSSVIQFRFLGGATALAIATAVSNKSLQDNLDTIVTPEQVATIFRDSAFINSLPVALVGTVRGFFVDSFSLEMQILIGFAAAQFPITVLMWQRHPIFLE